MRGKIACSLLLALLFCLSAALAETPVLSLSTPPALETLEVAYIRDGALVTNLNAPNPSGIIARYTGVDLGETAREVRCKARFYGGGAVALLVCPEGEWTVDGLTATAIHIVFAADGYYIGFCQDGVLKDVLTGSYKLDLSGEKEYTFGCRIVGSTLTVTLPTGRIVKKKDDRVKACGGPRVVFEHYLTAADAANGFAPAITYATAKGKELPAYKDDFEREDGSLTTAPTGHVYALFRNE
ncbi:MAG: hypothetical protein LBM74_00705 [Oscillospiraceae bacterium]|jgi:hypothetical protein|nr:hypothetical protein [Oscillospiraceae bacterium]